MTKEEALAVLDAFRLQSVDTPPEIRAADLGRLFARIMSHQPLVSPSHRPVADSANASRACARLRP